MAARHLQIAGYVGVVAVCFALGLLGGWNHIARRIDNQTYDWLSTPVKGFTEAVVVAIDDTTLRQNGEMPNLRPILAGILNKLRNAQPAAVAVDVTLAGASRIHADDDQLEMAFRATPHLILNCLIDQDDKWEDPLPRFATVATAVGHAAVEVDSSEPLLPVFTPGNEDGVSREIPLEMIKGGERHWALALETYRVAHGADIVESPDDLQVGALDIPAARPHAKDTLAQNGTRPMLVRYLDAGQIPKISVQDLDAHLSDLRGKAVFVGVTSQSAAHDRLRTPKGDIIAGVGVHAHAYETLRRGAFLTEARTSAIVAVCLALAVAIGATFWFLSGWPAYAVVIPLLGITLFLPRVFLAQDIVFPLVAPTAVAWLCAAGGATYRYFVLRRTLHRTESEKARYQQAIHWAAHEMRTPLTAIQGSSELMSRYTLPEEKRGQLSEMINSESKRLGKIIQTFLDMERLADGHMELKRESFPASEVVDVCLRRVAPLAERKDITITLDTPANGVLTGDRELMEYAFYNLLTNAVKYSPAGTHVRVRGTRKGHELHLAVQDEGIGMDAKEIKSIFQKFYRTKRAEASGEVGTGIGLSIVEQIVTHHGGRIDVASAPGKGSCFTMILTAQ